MREKTQFGNVVSSHSSACGASSFTTNERIDSRSCSCSSVKMKCRRAPAWSGLSTSVAAMAETLPSRSMAFDTLRYEVAASGVATVTLDQPETRNALSDQVLDELIGAFEAAREDEAVRCVVLTSSHEKVFSSGANLGAFAQEQPLVHKHLGTER